MLRASVDRRRGVLGLALAAVTCAASAGEKPVPCAALTSLAVPGFAVTIKQAVIVPAGPVPTIPFQPKFDGTLPEYCRADGVIDERIGRGGKPYAIGFAIALPRNWNGRYLFQGGGGLNGTVQLPLGAAAAGTAPALARGYAVISTDSGHTGAVFDADFLNDQDATLDFLYQAIGRSQTRARPSSRHTMAGRPRIPTSWDAPRAAAKP